MSSQNNTKSTGLADIEPDNFDVRLEDDALSSSHIGSDNPGLAPMHRQNIDDSRIDELLVEDGISEDHYPTIRDIADPDAVKTSFED